MNRMATAPTLQTLIDLEAELQKHILGCTEQIRLLTIALLSHGHVLIQGAPGMGKTTLAKSMASCLDCSFKRVQFTPDLLPADILGYSVYDNNEGTFRFHQGPVFCNVLLADEINRTTPRIQSALLEAMNEGQVSIDRETRKIDAPFIVVATQNHLYMTGTFPLPESQLDRFLVSFEMPRPDAETQARILQLHMKQVVDEPCRQILKREDLLRMQAEVTQIEVSDVLAEYVASLVEATHNNRNLVTGISARGALALMRTAQANAYLHGRKSAYPDDVKAMLPYVFQHRLSLRNRRKQSGDGVRQCLAQILDETPVL